MSADFRRWFLRLLPRVLLGAGFGVLLTAAAATTIAAQEIRGRFRTEGGDPLAAAFVTLLDGNGTRVAATLSDASGWFELGAPAPGRFTVRAEFIGYTTAEKSVDVTADAPAVVMLTGTFQPIELEGLTAEVDKACSLAPATARRVATLWDEVNKALRVTAYVERGSTYLFQVDTWTRRLDPGRLRILEETRRSKSGFHPGSPFKSLPPARLAAEGYVQGKAGSEEVLYYAPDAEVLLDRSFQDAHCFGFTPKGPEKGWVGLTFRPRNPRVADIEGTLWIDGATYAPLRLDYRYPVLPWPVVTDKVGGRVEFARIPEGPWIVHRWWIRMPVVQRESFRLTARGDPQVRYHLASILEDGGEVLHAKAGGDRALTFALGSIEGLVIDSVTRAAVAGAEVALEGTDLRARTAADGRFALTQVPEGRYRVSATTAELRGVGAPASSREVEVTGDRAARVEVRLPSVRQAAVASCVAPLTEDGEGVVVGRVTTDAGGVPAGASVEVSWTTVESLESLRGRSRNGAMSWRVDAATHVVTASVPVDAAGRYVVCGTPPDQSLVLQAVAPGFRGRSVRFRPAESGLSERDLVLDPVESGGGLAVQVFGPDHSPMEETSRRR